MLALARRRDLAGKGIRLRIATLARGITGGVGACHGALRDLGDTLLMVAPTSTQDTALASLATEQYARAYLWREPPAADELVRIVDEFDPDAILMQSWNWPAAYRTVMRTRRPHVLRITVMDNLWRATPKQWAGRAAHRYYLNPLFDCAMVASDRSEFFARRLGFAPENIIRGGCAADTDLFGTPPRSGDEIADRRRFLFAGRLVDHKGPDILAAAYRKYRDGVDDPWELHVAGIGPMAGELNGIPGVRMHGFLQPPELADLMRSSSCFVLPSRVEPYGFVVHEATAAGLPVLVSDFSGAAPGLVQDGYNGWVVAGGQVGLWADALARVSALRPDRLKEMSAISRALATRLSPKGWARNLHEEIERRLAGQRCGRRRARLAPRPTVSRPSIFTGR